VVAALGISFAHPAGASAATPHGRAARAMYINETAKVHLVHSNGESREVMGPATGTLGGSLQFYVTVRVTSFTFSFTFHVNGGGTMTGHGSGTLHIGHGQGASFAGTGVVNRGTGRWRHVSGSGHFYGAENRFSHNGTVQILATLHY